MTKAEAVEMYGTDKQKEHFAKYKKFTNKNLEGALTKTLEQHYESVELAKQGRAMVYELGTKREAVAEREDKRADNGKGQVPMNYEKAFPIMLLQHLQERALAEGEEMPKPQTTRKWLMDFGVITPEMFEASKATYRYGVLQEQIETLTDKKVIKSEHDSVVKDYINREIERLNAYFMQVVNRLAKEKIITHMPVMMAKCKVPHMVEYLDEVTGQPEHRIDYKTEYVELTSPVVGKVSAMEKRLQSQPKYRDLTLTDIHKLKGKPLVKEYWKDYQEELSKITNEVGERLYMELVYQAHALFVRAGDNAIIKWLEKKNRGAIDLYNSDSVQYLLENRNEFHEARHNYVVALAESRQTKYNTPYTVVKGAHPELGLKGREVKVTNNPYDDESIWDKNKELMHLGVYVTAYEKLQEYYGHTFK